MSADRVPALVPAVEQILGAAQHLRLRVSVDAYGVSLTPWEWVPPAIRRLFAHHERELHAYLWAIKVEQNTFIDSLPEHEKPELAKWWWRLPLSPEPTIPVMRVVGGPGDAEHDEDVRVQALADAERRGCALSRRIAVALPEALAFEIERDAGDGFEEEWR